MNSKIMNVRNGIIIGIAFCTSSLTASAQRDSIKKTTIDINSSYRPVLRNAVKINFSASQLNADTSHPVLSYQVPAQNLFYTYQPIPLNPLALAADTNLYLGMRNYLKLGFGNFSTPYVSGGFSFGDGKKELVNLYADYISSKGKIVNQDYSRLNIKALGSFFTAKNEVYGSAAVRMDDNYLYGYDHSLYTYKRDSVKRQFQDISLGVGIRNTVSSEYGISYDPHLQVNSFSSKDRLTESSVILNAPVQKQFGDAFAVKIAAKADITTYTSKDLASNVKFDNNIFQVSPSLAFSSPRFTINGGLIPTWDNGKFVWLPNVYAEGYLQDKVFLLQAGWVGKEDKNTFRNLSDINPFLETFSAEKNTKEIEYYGGIKATLGKHFNFNAKVGYISYTDFALYINDTASDGKSFVVVNESKAQNLQVHGDLSYINQDKFTVTAGLTLNGYTGFNNNGKAWNTVPMEITGSLRWWAFKQVLLKTDFYGYGGGNYLGKGNTSGTFKGGADLSAGVEFTITKMFSAWMDVNNVLNDKYERWHNYPVYGLNLLAGVKVNF